MNRIVAAALAVLPLVAAAQPAPTEPVAPGPAPEAAASTPYASATPVREGVYLGVGLGSSLLSEPDESGSSFRFRLGVTRSPRVMFGLEAGFVNGNSSTIVSYDAAATFFPWKRLAFFRGGFGFTRIDRRAVEYLGTGVGPAPIEVTRVDNGINLLLGLGLQLGRTDGINVTLNVDSQLHRVASGTRDVSTVCGWLGLEWH